MKIYIPCDISGNPFVSELVRGLESAGARVDIGLFRLGQPLKAWDIIHFQWPEFVLPGSPPAERDIEWLAKRLRDLRTQSKIVVTVHNESPHYRTHAAYERCYRLIYEAADAFVHMGNTSLSLLQLRHPAETAGKIHRVIPHGNYCCFGPRVDKSFARKLLGLKDIETALVIGRIRHPEEAEVIKSAGKALMQQGRQLVFAGKIHYIGFSENKDTMLWAKVVARVRSEVAKRQLKSSQELVFRPGPIHHADMHLFLSASDVLLIPRRRVLNSGNVALGFTFGNVVLGASVGNVGEILQENSNPTFPPSAGLSELAGGLDAAFDDVKLGVGERNATIASREWAWERIGQMHVGLYEQLLQPQPSVVA